MKIAFFTDSYLPNVDGVVTSICSFRKELEIRGHEVYIFSPGTKKQKEENVDPRVHYFTSTSFKQYPDYRLALINFLSPIKLVKEYGIEIIHSHGIATTGLAAIRSAEKLEIPALATFHTLIPNASHYITTNATLQNMVHGMIWKYLIWYYGHFKKILAPSNFAKKLLEEKGIKNISVHPSGIDLAKYKNHKKTGAQETKKKLGIKKNESVITFIGRIAIEKNLQEVLESIPTLLNTMPEIKVLIVGKGPALEQYKEIARKKDLEKYVIFTGYVEEALLFDIYAISDVFVFPSRFDTQGLAVVEALAAGVPAVVKENSAVAEYIENGKNGYVYKDNFDFTEKIVKAIKNKDTMSEMAKNMIEEFDIKKVTDDLIIIYEAMIREQKTKKEPKPVS